MPLNNWQEEKFWSFLIKDLSIGGWKYFGWMLLKKLLLAGLMGLTIGGVNAWCMVILQVLDLSVVFFMRSETPHHDRKRFLSPTSPSPWSQALFVA